MKLSKNDIGKLATFKTPYRFIYDTTTRVIKDVMDDGRIQVQFHGCGDFIISNDDIVEIKEHFCNF